MLRKWKIAKRVPVDGDPRRWTSETAGCIGPLGDIWLTGSSPVLTTLGRLLVLSMLVPGTGALRRIPPPTAPVMPSQGSVQFRVRLPEKWRDMPCWETTSWNLARS